jgi:2-C-methyl-D-erythritol 2,4-cyclodiphosphate synthase
MSFRVGMGFDIHKRVKGRALVLGGVRFETDWGLEGHSDADVLSHAIGDSLLGAAGMRDLGHHFPSGDPQWKDASSIDLLKLIRSMLDGAGLRIVNVDAMLLAEEPKIAPVYDAMIVNLASALRIGAADMSVKATTSESIGIMGRKEGIAAWSVALVDGVPGPSFSPAETGDRNL